ncbi:MAG: nucleotidyltransferase domain-containing protein [Clostridia bacterium]|nr:nucleotidyltransferase domain-containing protein [Clostridia bacterium]
MIYSLGELKRIIGPIASKYSISVVYLFGSYARGEATDSSDVDILIDLEGSAIRGLFDLGALYNDLSETLGKPVDLVTTDSIVQLEAQRRTPWLAKTLEQERIVIYEKK